MANHLVVASLLLRREGELVPDVHPITILAVNSLATNLNLNARDLKAYESYQAEYERYLVLYHDSYGQSTPTKPVFYRENREALTYVKAWIKANCGKFIDQGETLPTYLTNGLAYYTPAGMLAGVS